MILLTVSQPSRADNNFQTRPSFNWIYLVILCCLLYFFLFQQLQINRPPIIDLPKAIQPSTTIQAKSIKLQYTSANHVLVFGPSQVIVGSPTHALTMTLANAKAVDPIVAHVTPGPVEPRSSASLSEQIQPFSNTVSYVHPWPKVTVLYKPKSNAIVESEYHIEAGFNKKTINQIRINYNRPIEIDEKGRLLIKYDLGTMQESAPIAWQDIDGHRISVQVKFNKIGPQDIGFTVSGYDSSYPLIIDPSLTWNTFIGQSDSGNDFNEGMTIDGSGNIYVVGYSQRSWGNPIRNYSGAIDATIAKFDNTGSLIWNTFLGGTGNDYGYDITLDSSNNIHIGGLSSSSWSAPVKAYSNGNDGFSAKLDNNGNLLWNTFIGGTGDDKCETIDTDGAGNVYIAGASSLTWGTPVRNYTSAGDAYTAKLDSSGNLIWNTFLGSFGGDQGNALTLDASNNIYVTGTSLTTWGTPIRSFSGQSDIYTAKLDNNGNLLWNTFLGGGGIDSSQKITLDSSGNVYIGGWSNSSWGTPIRGYSSGTDICSIKLDNNGNLLWNTFLGGTGSEYGYSLTTDSGNNVYLTSTCGLTWGTPLNSFIGSTDIGLIKLDSNGNLLWHTFIGSNESDTGNAIFVDGSANIYIAGYSYASWGSPVRTYSTEHDGFIAKLDNSGTILWNSFLGGLGVDYGYNLSVDNDSNVYIVGYSSDSWGAPLRSYSSGTDAYVAKINDAGILLWHTFLGGTNNDQGKTIAVDSDNNVFIIGDSFGTWGTPIQSYSSNRDVFAAKLNSSGTLLWNTFLGGTGRDHSQSIKFDDSNNIYLGGYSDALWGTPIRNYSGSYDAFVAKLNSSGSILWNSFLGSTSSDSASSITIDLSHNIYISGNSPDTWGTPVRNHSGDTDGYIAKFDTNGNLIWNTFVGGAGGADTGYGLALDSSNNSYITGFSAGTWGTPLRSYTSNNDAYLAKVDTNGNLLWNTFLGGTGSDVGRQVTVNGSSVYTVGYSDATWGPPIWSYTSGYDTFIVKTEDTGNLIWNGFLGGTGDDIGFYIGSNGSNNIYISGYSDATWGVPIEPFHNSAYDGFIAKIYDPPPTPTITATSTITSTATHSPTVTFSPTITSTPTVSPTYSPTVIASPTPTATASPTLSPSPTKTEAALTSLLSNLIIYPNPFRAPSQQVTIQYTLSKDADVTITCYSYLGVKVKSIQIRSGENGGQGNSTGLTNQVTWDGRNNHGLLQSTGGYICQVVARSKVTGKQEKITSKIGLMR